MPREGNPFRFVGMGFPEVHKKQRLLHSGSDVKKTATFFDVSFLNFHIYFVSEQGNRFGAKVISLGYLGYLNF